MKAQPFVIIGAGAPTAPSDNGTLYFDSSNAFAEYVFAAGAWHQITATTPSLALPLNNVFVGNGIGVAVGVPVTGDLQIVSTGATTVLTSNGVAFGTAAFTSSAAYDPAGAAAAVAATLTGGSTAQVLTKNSNANFDYSWAAGGGGIPALPTNQIFVGDASNVATAVAMSGDASILASGAITVSKSGGVAFGSAAFASTAAFDIAGAAAAAYAAAQTFAADGSNISSGTVAAARLPTNVLTQAITIGFNGGGADIATGIGADIFIPYACTITVNTFLAQQTGSIAVDLWVDSYANYPPTVADSICGVAYPTITSAVKSQDATLMGWTTSIAAGSTLRPNVRSCSGIQNATLTLTVVKT